MATMRSRTRERRTSPGMPKALRAAGCGGGISRPLRLCLPDRPDPRQQAGLELPRLRRAPPRQSEHPHRLRTSAQAPPRAFSVANPARGLPLFPRMPQCQISPNRTILTDDQRIAEGLWLCPGEPYSPGCPGGEVYRRADQDLQEHLAAAISACASEFGVSQTDFSIPSELLLGQRPETVLEKSGQVVVYVNPEKVSRKTLIGQAAHEAFHVACSPLRPQVLKWSHELLAEHFRVRYLDLSDMEAAAEMHRNWLTTNGQTFPLEEVTSATGTSGGYYGRVFLLGQELIEATSWPVVRSIAPALKEDGRPDPAAWVVALPPAWTTEVKRILAPMLQMRC